MVAAAVAVGFSLRLAWVIVATTDDRARWFAEWNLRLADQLASGQLPSYGGVPTAYWPPGYAIILAPFARLSEATGWFGVNFAASLLNVAFGTVTIILVARIAALWFGHAAAPVAAWMMAIAVGQIASTSVAVSEPFVTALWVGFVLAVSELLIRPNLVPSRIWVGLGLLLGLAILTKDTSIFLIAMPAAVLRSIHGTLTGALRPTLLLLFGAALLLGPWTVRNVWQVGHWSPFTTITSEGLCVTKYDPDELEFLQLGGGPDALGDQVLRDCYTGSPFDNRNSEVPDAMRMPEGWTYSGPDEGAWARRNSSGFIRWAVTHPWHFVVVAPQRIFGAIGNDTHGGVELATQFGTVHPLGEPGSRFLQTAATAWYYAVAALALLAVVRIRAARRAWALWLPVVFLTLQTLAAPWSQSRHVFPAYPFIVVLAAAAWVAIRSGGERDDADPGRSEASGRAGPPGGAASPAPRSER